MSTLQITADAIRYKANSVYIESARSSAQKTAIIKIAEFHDGHREPQVCEALSSEIFQAEYRVTLSKREGPKQGRTTVFTFGL